HQVRVVINNGFARTEVDQVFRNDGPRDLEAVYSFPIPDEASLSELSLWMNGKEVIGEVLERKRAREIYLQETRRRVDPALAEKNSYKTFDITVFPVVANADTRLRLVYYQPVRIDANVGRYVYPLSGGGSDDPQAFWPVDEEVKESFTFDLTLKSAFPVASVRMPGYETGAEIRKDETADDSGSSVYHARINSASASLNKDIVFYYKLDDEAPARVELIPYRANASSEGTFMVVITPAADLERNSDGVDWAFVLDTSGSMRGANMSTLIDGVCEAVGKMSPQDRFRVIAFSDTARDITNGYVAAKEENVSAALEKVRAIKAGGGTELFAGIQAAYAKLDKNRTTAVLLVTDAVTNVSSDTHGKFLRLLEAHDVRMFTFVIGNSGDKPLMERLARDSGGFAMNISDRDDIKGRILQAKSHILHPCMRDVQLKITGGKVKDVNPTVLGNLYRGQQLVVFGHYENAGEVELQLRAKIGGQEKTWKCTAELPAVDRDNPELERLWALSSINEIMEVVRDEGETESLRQEIVKLGTAYSLVTDYTSMLVIMEESFKRLGIERKNEQRVQTERAAQEQRQSQPVKSYRVDNTGSNPSGDQGTFQGRRSPGVGGGGGGGGGSGPVGFGFIGLAAWLARRKKEQRNR
ncbi:MAG: VWA domain-containing protein, partial [Phycisphaerae bacterium]|nr:VWA domain-containing protein [Phycisphaerae bacterium]